MLKQNLGRGSPKKSLKRTRSGVKSGDSDSDSDLEIRHEATTAGVDGAWPRFLLVSSQDKSKPLSGMSPFLIEKWFSGVSSEGFRDIKCLRSGDFLVDCLTRRSSDLLIKRNGTTLVDRVVGVSVHDRLNSSRGVIRCRELSGDSELEIKSSLAKQGVTEVKRVSVRRDGQVIPTNTYFITFGLSKLPSALKIGYLNVPVSPFVPSPMRCFKCQKFGHMSQRCKAAELCPKCGDKKHEDGCTVSPKCVNCGGSHASSSRDCPVYQREQTIQKIRAEKNISFSEARKMVTTQEGTTYASKAAKAPTPQAPASVQIEQTQHSSTLERLLVKLLDTITNLVQRIEMLEKRLAVAPTSAASAVPPQQPLPVSLPVPLISNTAVPTSAEGTKAVPSVVEGKKAAPTSAGGKGDGGKNPQKPPPPPKPGPASSKVDPRTKPPNKSSLQGEESMETSCSHLLSTKGKR